MATRVANTVNSSVLNLEPSREGFSLICKYKTQQTENKLLFFLLLPDISWFINKLMMDSLGGYKKKVSNQVAGLIYKVIPRVCGVVWMVAFPKRYVHALTLRTCNVTLLGKRVNVDVIKGWDEIILFWGEEGALNPITNVLRRQRRRPRDHRGRDWVEQPQARSWKKYTTSWKK